MSSILSLRTLVTPQSFNVVLLTGVAALVPAKVLSTHLVEELIVRSVEVSERLQDLSGNLGMRSAFRLPQTAWPAAALWLLQAWEAFGLIEVEVFV